MPIAIAMNIILGQTVAAALKIPIYLDSIGTILVGVLAGPLAGAATGFLCEPALGLRDPATVPVPAGRGVRDGGGRHRDHGRDLPARRACCARASTGRSTSSCSVA